MKIQFAAFALAAAMLTGTSAAYACKDGCDCDGKKDASATATTTTAAPTATPASASITDKQEQIAQPAPTP